MKKILSFVLSALMLATCISFSAFAEVPEGKSMALTIGDITAKTGDTITVPVKIETAAAAVIGSMGIKVAYDTDVLEYVSETHQTPTNAVMAMANNANGIFTYSAIGGGSNFAFTSDVLFEMTFKVIGTTAGEYDAFEFTQAEYGKLLATDGKFSDVATTAGSLTIEAAKYDVTFTTEKGTAPNAMADVEAGSKITLPDMEDTDDYTFGGWSDGENTYAAGEEYEVTGDVTLAAVWNEIVRYTVTYNEGDKTSDTVIAGQSVTLPTLTNAEFSFKGWKIGDTDEVIAGGAEFTPAASVVLTAVWGGGKKLYIDTAGDDANNGLTKEAPIKTFKRAQEILIADAAADNTLDTIVVVSTYSKSDESAATIEGFCKGIGKKLYVTGLDENSVFDMYYIVDDSSKDSHFRTGTDIEFNNIKIKANYRDGGFMSMGYELTFGENVTVEGGQNVGAVHYSNQYKDGSVINILSGTYSKVDLAVQSGQTYKGESTINIGGTANTKITNGHGWQGQQSVFGINRVNINGGEVTSISLDATATTAVTNYAGLRYFTINGGTVGTVATTGSSVSAIYNTDKSQTASVRAGVTVYEINGGTVGTIALGTNKQTKEAEADDSTRVIIFNNDTSATVEDTGAIVVKTTGGTVKAVTNAYDADGKPTYGEYANASADWGKTVALTGFSYELDEDSTANAVKVGDTTYLLANLENDLIPAPAAGTYDVEFVKVYAVTIGEETTYVEAGESVSLTRLPQNGELKHIGWATTEGATAAEIDHTTNYTPTADVTLYPVWAEAVYFTATFETAHGTAPEAISVIDDNEDGVADAAFTFPGYDGKQDDHFTFAGWIDKTLAGATETAVKVYNAGETLVLSGNITFVAQWTEDPKATVTYVDAQATAPEAVTDYVGTEIEIAAPGTAEGLEFLGWTDGTNVYQAGDKLTIDADGVTLTAKWGVKITVDANGAKGEAPVIGGEIGEEIDLPATTNLTKVNHTFKGFALSADGEVITGKYKVNADDTLYVIWEETVADAAIIETKVVYNSATNDYTVDMYFYGKDANTVAFGYRYGENLEFVSFTPAQGLSVPHASLEMKEDGYYANAVANENMEEGGKIAGAAASAGNGVHLGTIAFAYKLTKDDYSDDDATDNIAITAPGEVVDNVSSAEYFLYTPAVSGLGVTGLPVVFDEAIEYEIVDVVYSVNGSVKVVRADGTAPKNYAEIEVYNEQGNLCKTFVIENAATETVDGVFDYSIGLAAGNYTLKIKKTGYLAAEITVEIAAQEGAGEEGFVPTPVNVELVELVAGDVVEVKGVIDLLDFAGITSMFGRGELPADITLALDIDEDGDVTVFDLGYIKTNYGETK